MTAVSHHLQELRGSCIAACVRMLRLAHGIDESEAAIRAALGMEEAVGSIDLRRASSFGTYRCLNPDSPAALATLRALVRVHGRCAVVVTDGAAAAWAHAASLTSPRGQLTVPDVTRATYRHAIVIVDLPPGRVRYLDPWYLAAGQPVDAPLEEFMRCWIGSSLVIE